MRRRLGFNARRIRGRRRSSGVCVVTKAGQRGQRKQRRKTWGNKFKVCVCHHTTDASCTDIITRAKQLATKINCAFQVHAFQLHATLRTHRALYLHPRPGDRMHLSSNKLYNSVGVDVVHMAHTTTLAKVICEDCTIPKLQTMNHESKQFLRGEALPAEQKRNFEGW